MRHVVQENAKLLQLPRGVDRPGIDGTEASIRDQPTRLSLRRAVAAGVEFDAAQQGAIAA